MIVDKLNDILNSHTNKSTLASLCLFIKENIDQIPQMSIDEVAKACYISKGQVSKCIRSLDYQNYEEFKDACKGYLDSLTRRKAGLNPLLSFEENNLIFSKELCHSIEYSLKHISNAGLSDIIKDIKESGTVYLYAQGDARSHCYNIQRELNIHYISSRICDVDFKKEYTFRGDDTLLFLSTNGNSFRYDKRIIKRIKAAEVKKWLITCNDAIDSFENTLLVPTQNDQYNEYLLRHVVDILLLHL